MKTIIILTMIVLCAFFVLADNETNSTEINETELNTTINQTETNTTINETDNNTNITRPYNWSIVIMPDSQSWGFYNWTPLWILNNTEEWNIKFLLQVGDINGNDWSTVDRALSLIENKTPYVFAYGNNDLQSDGEVYFPQSRFEHQEWYGGVFDHKNYYVEFNISNQSYMIISIFYYFTDNVTTWANGLIENNLDKEIIILTHHSNSIIENNMIKNNTNVRFIFDGHMGTMRKRVIKTSNSTFIYHLNSDWEDTSDSNRFRILTFEDGKVYANIYSHDMKKLYEEEDSSFTIYLNSSEGFITDTRYGELHPTPSSTSSSGSGGGGGGSRKIKKQEPIPCNKTKWSCEMWQIYPTQWTRDCINDCNQTRYEYKILNKTKVNKINITEEVIELELKEPIIYSEPIKIGFFKRIINYFKEWF